MAIESTLFITSDHILNIETENEVFAVMLLKQERNEGIVGSHNCGQSINGKGARHKATHSPKPRQTAEFERDV